MPTWHSNIPEGELAFAEPCCLAVRRARSRSQRWASLRRAVRQALRMLRGVREWR